MTENTPDGQPEGAAPMTGRERQIAALREHGKATQWKPGQSGNMDVARTNSMRAQVRHLWSRGEIVEGKDGKFTVNLPAGANAIQRVVALSIADALNSKSVAARARVMEFTTDQIDGKLIQPNLNADLAALQGMSEEEVDAYIAELQRLANQASLGISDGGEAAPAVTGAADEKFIDADQQT